MQIHRKIATHIVVWGGFTLMIVLSQRGHDQQVQLSLRELASVTDSKGYQRAWNNAVNCQGSSPCGMLTSMSSRISAFHRAEQIQQSTEMN